LIPNVELFTFVVFLSGVLLGPASGMRVGIIAAAVYGVFNVWGAAHPLLLAALIVARALIGAIGGWMRRSIYEARPRGRILRFAAGAVLASVVFHTLTNLAIALTVGQLAATFVAGAPFALLNTAVNVPVFGALGPQCVEVARRLPIPGAFHEGE
jgi:uncharacterized membrane protein